MIFRNVLVVARKEFRDVLRDRRTLLFMMLLPIAAMPALMIGMSHFVKAQLKEKETRTLVIAMDPDGQGMLTALANRWLADNVVALGAAATRIGLEGGGLSSLHDLSRLAERVESLRGTSSDGGSGAQGAALVAWAKAFQTLQDDQKQLLMDAAAVSRLREKTEFRDLAELDEDGKLATGVEIPEDLPAPLADPTVTLAIQNKTIHGALYLPRDVFDRFEEAVLTAPLHMLYDSSWNLSKEAHERLEAFVGAIRRHELAVRLNEHNLAPGFARPMELRDANVASQSRQLAAGLGGLIPYLVILFAFMGALYPALDIAAGEKERGTLETLLLAPVSRLELAAGKFVVVFTAAVVAAVMATASMYVTMNEGILPANTLEELSLEFEPLALFLTGTLLIPVAAVFAAALLGVGIFARSYKEAQSYAVPLNFVVIIPAITALLPDLEAELHLAWIPLVNVSMLTKELLKANYLWSFYFITLGSMLALAALLLWTAGWMFRRESVLMRS